jgi:hypothetical protein
MLVTLTLHRLCPFCGAVVLVQYYPVEGAGVAACTFVHDDEGCERWNRAQLVGLPDDDTTTLMANVSTWTNEASANRRGEGRKAD